MHQRSRYNPPTTEQPSGQRSAPKDELSLPVTATKMQTAAMRTRSQVKTGNSNNSKVMDSNPHSGPMLRLRANSADNKYNTAGRAENVPRQGRPRKTIIRRDVTTDHHGGINLFNNYNTISQFHSTGCIPSFTSSINNYSFSNNNNVGIHFQEIVGLSEVSRLDITALPIHQPQQHQQQQPSISHAQSSPQRPSRSIPGVIATSSGQQRIHSPSTNIGSPLLTYPSLYPHPSSSPLNSSSSNGIAGHIPSHPASSQSQPPPPHRTSSPVVSTSTQGGVRTGSVVRTRTGSTGTVGTQEGVRTGTESLAETTYSAFPQSPTSPASRSSFTPVSVNDAAHQSALQRLYLLPEASRLLNSDFLLFTGVVTARQIDMLAEFDVVSTGSNQQWFQRHSEIVQDVMLRINYSFSSHEQRRQLLFLVPFKVVRPIPLSCCIGPSPIHHIVATMDGNTVR